MKRKAEITFEVEETTIVRQAAETLTLFCPQCQAEVERLARQFAAELSGLSEREIFRLLPVSVNAGSLVISLRVSIRTRLKTAGDQT